MHVSKTWPIKADTIHEIEDFAMWGLKRTENISWTETKTNEKVLAMMGEKRRLMEKMIKTKKEMD